MVTITITNQKCKLDGPIDILKKIRVETKIRNPNAFFIMKKMGSTFGKKFDGSYYPISEYGYIHTGYLQTFIDILNSKGIQFKLNDQRLGEELETKLVTKFGDKTLRPYQENAVMAFINNYIKDSTGEETLLPRGIIDAATNAGKSLIICSLYKSLNEPRTLVLINDGLLFEQMVKEFPKMIPGVGFIRGKKIELGKLTIAMVQTLNIDIDKYKNLFANIELLVVDECDLGTSKSYQNILKYTINCPYRIGLSGSVFKSKDKIKNHKLLETFGSVIYKISAQELIELEVSADIIIKVVNGNTENKKFGDYNIAYKELIVNNKNRYKSSINRMEYYIKNNKLPALVVVKFIPHCELTYNYYIEHFGNKYKIAYIHHDIPDKEKKQIMLDFSTGKIQILIATLVIRRGHNLPLIRYIQNFGGGDSESTLLQIIGRGHRITEGKIKTYMDEFYDRGEYIERHSKHRLIYYKKEGYKIIDLRKTIK